MLFDMTTKLHLQHQSAFIVLFISFYLAFVSFAAILWGDKVSQLTHYINTHPNPRGRLKWLYMLYDWHEVWSGYL